MNRIILVSLAGIAMVGCAAPQQRPPSPAFAERVANSAAHGEEAIVIQVRPVDIVRTPSGTNTALGATSGAILGGAAGSKIGKGNGSKLATVLGGIWGGAAGAKAAEMQAQSGNGGVELILRTVRGNQIVAVVQAEDGQHFVLGQRVFILQGVGGSRVVGAAGE